MLHYSIYTGSTLYPIVVMWYESVQLVQWFYVAVKIIYSWGWAGVVMYAFICTPDRPFLYVSIGRRLWKKCLAVTRNPYRVCPGVPQNLLIDAKPYRSYHSHFLSCCDKTFLYIKFLGEEKKFKTKFNQFENNCLHGSCTKPLAVQLNHVLCTYKCIQLWPSR